MNKKGQALVEFILILPVFLLILFAVVDFGNLLVSKNQLESTSNDIARIVLNGSSVFDINREYPDYHIDIQNYQDKYRKIIITKDVKVITPMLDRFLGDPCVVRVERIIPVVSDGGNNEES